jgi:hypothetical protein
MTGVYKKDDDRILVYGYYPHLGYVLYKIPSRKKSQWSRQPYQMSIDDLTEWILT